MAHPNCVVWAFGQIAADGSIENQNGGIASCELAGGQYSVKIVVPIAEEFAKVDVSLRDTFGGSLFAIDWAWVSQSELVVETYLQPVPPNPPFLEPRPLKFQLTIWRIEHATTAP